MEIKLKYKKYLATEVEKIGKITNKKDKVKSRFKSHQKAEKIS